MEDTPTKPKRQRSIKLKTAADLQRLLAKTINQLLRGEIEQSTAGKVGYLCNIMINSFQIVNFEERLQKLEAHTNNNKPNK